MGFPQNQSEAAIQAFGTVQAALEALLAGKGESHTPAVYILTGNTVLVSGRCRRPYLGVAKISKKWYFVVEEGLALI